ncbi:MAG: hypothetical protein RDU89_02950 [bacterium]|nr:hypothetical protein [bacterium]
MPVAAAGRGHRPGCRLLGVMGWELLLCYPLAGFLPVVVFAVAILALILGQAADLPVFFVAVPAWMFARSAAGQDDRAGTWAFTRALPVAPAQVVAVRFLASLLATLALALAVGLPLVWLGGGTWPANTGMGFAAGVALSSLFNAAYYRFGYRFAAAPAHFAWLSPAVWLLGRLSLSSPAPEAMTLARATSTSLIAAAVVCAAAWVYASMVFADKDIA